jgi:hypothetical protein
MSAINLSLSICFNRRSPGATLAALFGGSCEMPKTLAQITGLIVTTIVVLGCDMDVVYAVPLGMAAGALATFFAALAEQQIKAKI